MALKIEHECDMSGVRQSVSLPTSGPLDLGNIPLPEGWVRRPKFDGVGPQDDPELVLCADAIAIYEQAVLDAEAAKRSVLAQAFTSARQKLGLAGPTVKATGPHRSSSFAGAR